MKKPILALGFALILPGALHAQNAIGEVFASDASVRGSVALSGNGTRVLSGSQVSAGDGAALLKLERGGELRICPKTNLSLSTDADGKALVLGLNAGSMELNYGLQTSADTLVTPDFRMQLISPGNFHLAISVAPSGDTCMRSLPGNDAAVFVAEMMGTESYQLSPGKSVLFRGGSVAGATEAPAMCGCPAVKAEPRAEKERTEAPAAAAKEPAPVVQASQKEAEPHLEVNSSFVYRGSEVAQDYYASVARLSVSVDNSALALALLPKVSAPVAKQPGKPVEKKEGLLHRFGSFLGRLFGK